MIYDYEVTTGTGESLSLAEADPDWDKKPDIKWNFTKFIIDREGNVVARFEPTVDMSKVEECVKALL